jgi:urease subunit gamma
VYLTPSDRDKLLLAMAGLIARERRERGVKLNYPEAVALISTWVIERARDGATVEQLMRDGRDVLTRPELMAGVPELLGEVQVEATFPDGRKLVTIHDPVR